MAWLQLLTAIVTCITLIGVAGPFLAWIYGFRGLFCWLTGIPLAFMLFSVSGILAQFIHVPWGIWFVAAIWLILAFVALLIRRKFAFHPETPVLFTANHSMRWIFAGVGLAAVISGIRLGITIESPNLLAQFWDTPFQANQTWWILKTNEASSLRPILLGTYIHGLPYPLGWHSAAALVSQTSTIGVVFGNNALLLVTVLLVWPLGVGILTALLSANPRAGFVGATISGALPQFPALLMWWALSPNLLAYVLMTYALALAFIVVMLGKKGHVAVPLAALLIAFSATILTQPNAAITLLFFTGIMLAMRLSQDVWRSAKGSKQKRGALAILTALAVFFLIALLDASTLLVPQIRRMRVKSFWAARAGIRDAVTDVLLGRASYSNTPYLEGQSIHGGVIPILLMLLVWVGGYFALTRMRTAWVVLLYAFSVGLFVVAMRLDNAIGNYITGYWYGDPERLAALVGITSLLLISVAVYRLAVLARQVSTVVTVVAAVLVAIVAQASPYMRVAYEKIQTTYSFDGEFLSENDLRLFERIDEEVPAGQMMLGDPWDGSLYAPAYTDRSVLVPYWQERFNKDFLYLVDNLEQAETDPQVCDLLKEQDINYALILEDNKDGDSQLQKAVKELVQDGRAELVDQVGDAQLVHLDVCD